LIHVLSESIIHGEGGDVPKRTICVRSPAKLSIRNSLLVVSRTGSEVKVPLDEIWVLILETPQAQITTSALSGIVDAGIGVMVCGRNHMPNGLLLPLGAHSRHAAIVEDQLLMSKPLKKRLWQRTVATKIDNQMRALQLLGKKTSALEGLSSQVRSGDATAREAVAASAYFRELLPDGTRREGPYSAALDYGYAVLRAGIARKAVSGGWLVSRGVFHSSDLNAFNLVDDLIEPFRPVVDLDVIYCDLREVDKGAKQTLTRVFDLNYSAGEAERMTNTS